MIGETVKSVHIENPGEPEVMSFVGKSLMKPNQNEVTIQHKAIGLNFIDIYHRKGIYPLSMPTGLGMEGSGIILDVGKNVRH